MRTFLVNLGMVGAEFAYCRKLMIKNLDGNSAYRYSKPDSESKPRRERIHKEVISIRLTPETLHKLTELASQNDGNMSRNRLIEAVIEEYIQTEYTSPETADLPPTEADCGEESKAAESTEEPPEENPT
jgi:predicted transcriptional regulator